MKSVPDCKPILAARAPSSSPLTTAAASWAQAVSARRGARLTSHLPEHALHSHSVSKPCLEHTVARKTDVLPHPVLKPSW